MALCIHPKQLGRGGYIMALCIHPHKTGEGVDTSWQHPPPIKLEASPPTGEGWIYRGIIYSLRYNWRGGGYIVVLYIHHHTAGEGLMYHGILYSPIQL